MTVMVKGCKVSQQHPHLLSKNGNCCLGHEMQVPRRGNFGLATNGLPLPRTFREWLCDTFSGGKHWFWGDNGGHTGIGPKGPEVARRCKLCGNHIKWS